MPFKSEAQRRYLWANEPEIARDWTDTYGSRIQKNTGGISQLVKSSGDGKRPGYAGWDYSDADMDMGSGYHGTSTPSSPHSKPSNNEKRNFLKFCIFLLTFVRLLRISKIPPRTPKIQPNLI